MSNLKTVFLVTPEGGTPSEVDGVWRVEGAGENPLKDSRAVSSK